MPFLSFKPLFAPIVQLTPGLTEIVAAVPDKRIRVYGYLVVLDVAGRFRFIGAADLTGNIPVAANGGVAIGAGLFPVFESEISTPLSIVTVSGVANGHLVYALA